MKELVPDVKNREDAVPFAAVAADLLTGREVVLELRRAVRAHPWASIFDPLRSQTRASQRARC